MFLREKIAMPQANLFPLIIDRIIRETGDAKTFILKNISGVPLTCRAGQFLTFVFRRKDGEEDRRSYSLSSAPALWEPLQVTVKRVPNGAYSRWLVDAAKEGDQLFTTGASGFFVLPEKMDDHREFVFFAAGSGITPVYSLIRTLLHNYPHTRLALVYSNTRSSDAIFYDALIALRQLFTGRLRITFLFSREQVRGRLNVEMIGKIAADHGAGALYYLCGPLEYMQTITIVLRTGGVPEANIRKEIFHSEKPVIRELPSDQLPHNVRVTLGDTGYSFTAQYPATILQAAKALGIPLPYSCEAGQCGTCSATCVEGKVWMWHNDVLLDDDIAKGRVLTCTGFAVGGDIDLVF